ncbi:MAG: hypothetical protein K6G72_08215 [Lachnospiraceae bacterium]|nr:hypothetical protein [Lachnospiraceae bacterium]
MFSFSDRELNKKTARGLRKVLGVFMVLSLLCALTFIAFEAHHECEGEECPICACLEECVRTVRGIGDSLPILSTLVVIYVAAVTVSLAESEEIIFNTPILFKVRMNN